MSRPHRALAAIPAGLAAVAVLAAGCSGSSFTPQSSPSINFGSDLSTTPGMVGHATASAPAPVLGAHAPETPAAPAPAAGPGVTINNFAFVPAMLTVPVGTTVTWTNQDEEPHTVAAKDGSFHSPGMDSHGTYSHTFATPGTFDYICSIHPFMAGTVVVSK